MTAESRMTPPSPREALTRDLETAMLGGYAAELPTDMIADRLLASAWSLGLGFTRKTDADLGALLDEADAMIAADEPLVPESGWMTVEQAKQRGSLQGQAAAIGWLRNRARAAASPATPDARPHWHLVEDEFGKGEEWHPHGHYASQPDPGFTPETDVALRALADAWEHTATIESERTFMGDPAAAIARTDTLRSCARSLRAALAAAPEPSDGWAEPDRSAYNTAIANGLVLEARRIARRAAARQDEREPR